VNPNSVVITEDLAQKYFANREPLGQTLTFDKKAEYTVTGVMQNVPANSHFTFSFLVSMETYANPRRDSWSWLQYYTYLLLDENTSTEVFPDKFTAVLRRHLDQNEAAKYSPFLQPLTDIHLHSNLFREMETNSDITYIYIFSAVALFILLIACINFMNLTTARAAIRTKEVGVRKVSGADRRQLVKQFLGEAVLTSFFAFLLGLVFIEFLLPVFNFLTGRLLSFNYYDNVLFLSVLTGIAILVGLISGSYPALVLSAFKPADSLKGKKHGSGGHLLRKGLVVFQFTISISLMIATGIVYHQLDYIQNKKLGFQTEQLVIIPIRDDAMRLKYETVKQQLLQHSGVVSATASGNLPGGGDWGIPYRPEGFSEDQIPPMRMLVVDQDFVATFGIELAAGRVFSKDYPGDAAGAYMINEEAAEQLGWENPTGKLIAMPAIEREAAPVIGVLKDFHFRSMREKIGPIMLFIPPPAWFSFFSVRVRPQNISETLTFLEKKWAEFDPDHPFDYAFLDERINRLHQSEKRMGRLLGHVAILAIFIACLGLFGLAAFTAERRTKEIGIRKVLGASVGNIILLLSKDFAKLVLTGFIVSLPFSYYVMNRWLQNFAYHIDIGWWVFALSGGLALIIALLTVSYQAVRAAIANPVKALRYE
jgi:putative ABC transport system permease protein